MSGSRNDAQSDMDCYCETVSFIGNSFQFSDRLLRILKMDFSDIIFERLPDIDSALNAAHTPRVIVVHEAAENIEEGINILQRKHPDARVAIACKDTRLVDLLNSRPCRSPVSALNMDAQVDIWFSILRLLLSGYHYVPVNAQPTRNDRDAYHEKPKLEYAAAEPQARERLTPRELEILPMIAQGAQNKVIADTLGLSIHTVKLHSHNIFTKLGVTNRTGAANWYLSNMADRVLDDAASRPR